MQNVQLSEVAPPALLGSAAAHGRRSLPRRPGPGRLARWAPPALMFVIFIGLWYLVSEVVLDEQQRFLLPPPDAVVAVAFLDPVNRAPLLSGLLLSASIAMLGLLIAAVLGMAVGIAMSQARWVERTLYPYAVILQCIPTLALVPVIGFWFDFGFASRLIVTVAIAVFPVISSTLFGLQSVERSQHDLLTLHRAGRLTRLLKLQLPNAMPAILTGLQVAATLAVVGAVVGDFFFRQGDAGIGVLIDLYRARLQSEQLFGAAILACLLGVGVFSAFGLLNRVVTGGWHGSAGYHGSTRAR
jgi:NitT/TauT family transport system permease protein